MDAVRYSGKAPRYSGTPYVRNVTFEDIQIESTGFPGAITGLPESCFMDLTFRNVSFGSTKSPGWNCNNVQMGTFVHDNVTPPISGCKNNNSVGTCA